MKMNRMTKTPEMTPKRKPETKRRSRSSKNPRVLAGVFDFYKEFLYGDWYAKGVPPFTPFKETFFTAGSPHPCRGIRNVRTRGRSTRVLHRQNGSAGGPPRRPGNRGGHENIRPDGYGA